jgi:hypothetical protein
LGNRSGCKRERIVRILADRFRDAPIAVGRSFASCVELNALADLKLYMMVQWLTSGALDHVPTSVLDHCPNLQRLYRAVSEHPGVKRWLSRQKS